MEDQIRKAFCMTCKGRLDDLRLTLPVSLSLLQSDEFVVLLDYNSFDGLRQYVLQTFPEQLRSGSLHFYSERTAPRFIRSHAKNVSHLLGIRAGAGVLINLDADNRLSSDYLHRFRAIDWTKCLAIEPQDSGGWRGRVGMLAPAFLELGGHNESMIYGYGYEEIDISRRLKAAAHRGMVTGQVCSLPVDPADVIPTPEAKKLEAQSVPGTSRAKTNEQHQNICVESLKRGQLTANVGRNWGHAELVDWNDVDVKIMAHNGAVKSTF